MEARFVDQQYLVGQERRDFAATIGLDEFQVKIWWQNRRIKTRRLQHEANAAVIEASRRRFGI